jgi:ribonuclease HI
MACLLDRNPLTKGLARRALRKLTRRSQTPLVHSFSGSGVLHQAPSDGAPWHQSPFIAHIDPHADIALAAASALRQSPDHSVFFSDGSHTPRGTAVAAYDLHAGTTLDLRLGTPEHHGVPEAEINGVNLALDLAAYYPTACRTITIFLDNESVVHRLGRASGRPLVRSAWDKAKALQLDRPGLEINLRWVPGHAHDEGNDFVDSVAKRATDLSEYISGEVVRPGPMDPAFTSSAMPVRCRRAFRCFDIFRLLAACLD